MVPTAAYSEASQSPPQDFLLKAYVNTIIISISFYFHSTFKGVALQHWHVLLIYQCVFGLLTIGQNDMKPNLKSVMAIPAF